MDAKRFDRLVLTLAGGRTRRSLLGLLAGLGFTGLVTRDVTAQNPCRENGEPCTAGTECCSGRCVRKPGTRKKFCRQAPGQGICTIESTSCGGIVTFCHEPGPDPDLCLCFVTSRGYSFCGDDGGDCFACETDTDCVKRPGGRRGDRCVVCASCGPDFNNRSCQSKCPDRAQA